LYILSYSNDYLQNLQQSRGFGSFKFPEGQGQQQPSGNTGGNNTGFGEDTADDDLYA